jgi:hypothetical protein
MEVTDEPGELYCPAYLQPFFNLPFYFFFPNFFFKISSSVGWPISCTVAAVGQAARDVILAAEVHHAIPAFAGVDNNNCIF